MGRPTNSIGTIKLPGENTERPLVPYALGYSKTNSYQATLPQLTADAEILVNNVAQTINSVKTFNSNIYINSKVYFDTKLYLAKDANGRFSFYVDNNQKWVIGLGDSYTNNHISPLTDVARDLGKANLRYRDVYVGRNLTDGTNTMTINNIQPKITAGTGITLSGTTISTNIVIDDLTSLA